MPASVDFLNLFVKLVKWDDSLSYGKIETEILFLKVWNNFVKKINAIEQYLVGESFFFKQNFHKKKLSPTKYCPKLLQTLRNKSPSPFSVT